MTVSEPSNPPVSNAGDGAPETATVVADLGARSKKSIRRLKLGGGRLLGDVHSLMDQLKADSVTPEGARAIVVVVKEKKRPKGVLPFWSR